MNQRDFLKNLFESARGTVYKKGTVTGGRQLQEMAPPKEQPIIGLANQLLMGLSQDVQLPPEIRDRFIQSVEMIHDYQPVDLVVFSVTRPAG